MTTATDIPDLGSLREEQARLRARLARLRRRLQLEMALETVLDATAALAGTAAVLVPLDWWFRLGLRARLLLLTITLIGVVVFLGLRAVRRWRAARLDDLTLAVLLDRFRPGTGGRVADVLQLPDLLNEPPEATSPALVRLAVRQASDALAASDWASLWNQRRTATRSVALLTALAVPVLFTVLAPGAARLSLARWLLGSSERWPQRTYLTVTGLGDRNRLLAPRDEPFPLEVRADLPGIEPKGARWVVPGRGEPLALRRQPRNPVVPNSVRIRERTAKGAVRDALMVATGPASFRHEIPPSSASSSFELIGGDDWLGPVTVERVDRPSLAAKRLRAREPGTADTTLQPVAETQNPVFLPDTEVELTLVGSEPIAEAHLTVHPGQPPRLVRGDEKTFTARWTLHEPTTLEIQLTSSVTGLTSKPEFLSLGIIKDRVPRVALRALGVGSHVTPVATIPLSLSATDDRGLAALRLLAERTTTEKEKNEPKTTKQTIALPLGAGGGRVVLDHQARHDVELQADNPKVGTVLRFVGEAEDRCAQGAQTGRSNVVQMQVVSPDELFYEILIRQRAERARFVTLLVTTEKHGSSLAGSPKAEAYTAVVRGLHAASRQLDQIAGRLADTLQEMKLNQVGSPKSHRLLQESVIDPIRALNAGPLSELRRALQSLAGSGPKTGADAASARRLHKDVVARMKAILEQMSQWESFVDVVNQVAEVIKLQRDVLRETEKARETRTREVFDE